MADSIAGLAADDREIERKYLLTGLPGLPDAEAPLEIEQGYLPGDKVMERVRHVTSPDGEQFVRTVKQGSGLARLEVEEELSRAAFDLMWPLTEGRRLRKRRYRVSDGALTWEVDEFLDRKLVLAEVELASSAPPITLPDWLQPFVSRDVTEDESYSNFRLAGGDRAPLGAAEPRVGREGVADGADKADGRRLSAR
jgi:CYTH domain-containing protein